VLAYALAMLTYDAWSFIQVTFLLFFLLGVGSVVLQLDEPVPAPAPEPVSKPLARLDRPIGEPAVAYASRARRGRLSEAARLPNLLFALGIILSVKAARARSSS
jgi:hypothetical protein